MVHQESLFSIYFGDERDSFDPHEFFDSEDTEQLLYHPPFSTVQKMLSLKELFFLKQVHGVQGVVIDLKIPYIKSFHNQGDYLITHCPDRGIGVATADCLPIIFYCSRIHAIAVIHAGWRGSVEKITQIALKEFCDMYKTRPDEIRVFFGPCAKSCCYTIGKEVLQELDSFSFYERIVYRSSQKIFFDLPLLNTLQLQEAGVLPGSINFCYNICTICNEHFCSYRRSRSRMRQMTIVALR